MAAALQNALSAIQAVRYSEIASSTIMVFDHLTTLDREIELIWKAPWSPGKCLFIINRYYAITIIIFNNYGVFTPNLSDSVVPVVLTLFAVFNDSSCLNYYRWQGWTGLGMPMIAEVVLQLRIYALYYLNKRLLLLMFVAFLASSAASATVMGIVLSNIQVVDIPGIPFCVVSNIPNHFYAFWIPVLVFETFLFSLALFRFLEHPRSPSTAHLVVKRIFRILIRDSILYFSVIFATYLVNLIMFLAAPKTLIEVPIGFSVAMSSVMCNRILLNVREKVQETPLNEGALLATEQNSAGPGMLSDLELDDLRANLYVA